MASTETVELRFEESMLGTGVSPIILFMVCTSIDGISTKFNDKKSYTLEI